VLKKQRRSKRKTLTEKDFFIARIGVSNPVDANHPVHQALIVIGILI
jgi:hypothetical protein